MLNAAGTDESSIEYSEMRTLIVLCTLYAMRYQEKIGCRGEKGDIRQNNQLESSTRDACLTRGADVVSFCQINDRVKVGFSFSVRGRDIAGILQELFLWGGRELDLPCKNELSISGRT